LWKPIWEGKF